MQYMKSLLGLVLAGMLASAGVQAGFEAQRGKDIQVVPVQQPIAEISNPAASFRVSAWVDRDSLSYAPGEQVTFFVKTTKDAYIHLLDVGTSGKVHIIFPNEYQQDNFVSAGETVRIPAKGAPFAYQVGGPPGVELIKVIATTGPRKLYDVSDLKQAGVFKTFEMGAEGVAKDIGIALDEVEEADWAAYEKVFEITD